MGQPPYLHSCTGRERAKILHPDVHVSKELLNISHIGRGLHDIMQCGSSSFESGLDILPHLTDVGSQVSLAHNIAVAVAGQLARHKNRALPSHHYHMRIQHMASHHTCGESLRLNVLALHGLSPLAVVGGTTPLTYFR